MDDINRNLETSEILQWWTSAPELDENALRDGVLALQNKIHQAAVYDDWDAVREHIKLYQLGETFCTEEPQLSTYNSARWP